METYKFVRYWLAIVFAVISIGFTSWMIYFYATEVWEGVFLFDVLGFAFLLCMSLGIFMFACSIYALMPNHLISSEGITGKFCVISDRAGEFCGNKSLKTLLRYDRIFRIDCKVVTIDGARRYRAKAFVFSLRNGSEICTFVEYYTRKQRDKMLELLHKFAKYAEQ
ncbi:MAG: hypothetical protein WC363_04710 [Candidatus Izemoplasmatales bacterium]|jgi:hypothetical protein